MLKRFQRKEYFCLAAVLLVFLLMSLYKLTDALPLSPNED